MSRFDSAAVRLHGRVLCNRQNSAYRCTEVFTVQKNGFVVLAAIVAIRTLINFHEGIYTEELIRRSMYRILPLLLLGGFFLTGEF